jgi:hypothetical protein
MAEIIMKLMGCQEPLPVLNEQARYLGYINGFMRAFAEIGAEIEQGTFLSKNIVIPNCTIPELYAEKSGWQRDIYFNDVHVAQALQFGNDVERLSPYGLLVVKDGFDPVGFRALDADIVSRTLLHDIVDSRRLRLRHFGNPNDLDYMEMVRDLILRVRK